MSALVARGINTYRQADVQSRTPLQLVVMLYDGALRFSAEAREAMLQRDIRKRAAAISRTMAIVSELQSTLNMEAGGEIAAELDRLYLYVRDRLLDASFRQDVRPLDEAIKVLQALRESWGSLCAEEARAPAP
jgi:flagellar protein FliS